MRWYLETNVEPLRFWEAAFDGGTVTVHRGAIGSAGESEVLEFGDLQEAVAAIRELAVGLFAEGYEQVVPPDERYQADPRIARFWTEELVDRWKAMGVTEREPTDYRDRWVEYLAAPLPPELDQFLTWRSSHDFGYCNFGEWRIWDADEWLPSRADGNLFEQLVISDQENYLGTAMMEHFASWVFIGTAGNGDSYFAHPNHADPSQAEVVFFDHETHSPDFVIADSVASLAWLNHCYEELSAEDFDQDQLTADFGLLEDRVNLSWHYGDLEEESGIAPEYEAKSRAIYYFYRATWIDYLLRQNGVVEVENVADLFYPDFHAPLQFADALESPYLKTSPITALYWLWRLWWFDKPELASCLEAVADHPSPIVTDCAALIVELQNGRKTLGKIEDIGALRNRFLALDIDPDRAEERAAEEIEAAQRAQQALEEKLEEAHRILASGSNEEVREALWDFVEFPDVLDVMYEHLQHSDPEARPWIRRYAFKSGGGATRNNRSYTFENDEIDEVTRRHGALLGPRYARSDAHPREHALAAHAAGDRVRSLLVAGLDATDKFRQGNQAAARGLAALGATEYVPRLVELSEELRWDPGDYLAEIEREDALLAVIEALGALGGDTARDALIAVLDGDLQKLWPRAIVALGQLGDAAAVDKLKPHLQTANSRPTLFALAQIGSADARAAVDAHVATLAGGIVDLAYERAMQQLAAARLGDAVDFELVERLTRVIESKKYEDTELHLALVALLAGHPDRAAAVRLLTEYLHHESERVRAAAIDELAALDALGELRWLDRPTVDALFESEGVEGLRTAMADPHAIFRHNALRKAVDEGIADRLSDEACELASLYCRFTDYTNGYVQDAHQKTHYVIEALAQVGTDDALRLLCAMWKGDNAMYRDADVIKYDRNDLQSRLEPFVEEILAVRAASAPPEPQTVSARPFASSSWLFGGCVNGIAFSPDGTRLAVGGEGGVKLFDADGAVVCAPAECAGAWVYDVTFSPDGQLFAAGAHAGHLWLFDAENGTQVAKLAGHSGVPTGVRKMRFSPSGEKLASVSDDQTMRIWDIATHDCIAVWEDTADVNAVDWIDEETLVIGTDRMVRRIAASGEEIDSKSCSGAAEVRVNTDRGRIYVGTGGKKLRVYSLELKEKRKEHFDRASVARIRFRDDHLVVASWEGDFAGVSLVPYDGSAATHLADHHASTFALDLHPRSDGIFAGGRPGIVGRWTANGDAIASEGVFHTDEIASIRFCGDEVVTSSDDHTAIRWSADGEAIAVYRSPVGRLCDAVIDDGRVFVTGSEFSACFELDGTLVWRAEPARSEHLELTDDAVVVASYDALWWLDRRTGDVLHQTEPFADSFIFRWARLDDRRLAVAGYDDQRLFVFDLQTRELADTWQLPSAERGGMCNVTSAGGRVFVSRWDKSVVVLDAAHGTLVKRAALSGTRYPIGASPDGSLLYATGANVEVYDTATFEQIATINVGVGLEELEVGPDGRVFFGAKSGELLVADPR